MQLDPNSIHARFWRRTNCNCKWLPDNLCTYFWDLVFYVCCLPLTWATYITARLDPPTRIALGGAFYIAFLVLILFGDIAAALLTSDKFWRGIEIWTRLGFDFILGLSCVIIAFLVLVLVSYLVDLYNKGATGRTYVLVELLRAKKKKYCPHITWKND